MFHCVCLFVAVLVSVSPAHCFLREFFDNREGLELVSQLKNATQSSNHGPGIAARAVDGGTNGNYFAHSCSHTLHGLANPWWYVDLESSTPISKIVIYNRNDCCGERLVGAVIRVGDDHSAPFTGNSQCGTTVTQLDTWSSQQIVLSCDPPIEGQYISVYVPGNNALSLCELKAYTDVRKPILYCPMDIVLGSDVNQRLNPITWETPVVDDNEAGLMVMCTRVPGSMFDVGFTKVVCSATDSSGNEGNCSFVVEVKDTEEPSLACPDHITINNDVDQSENPVMWTDPTVTDNIHSDMVARCSPGPGTIFDVGSTIVTCFATDGHGNNGSCMFVVHVMGQSYISDIPRIACPHNTTVTAGGNLNSVAWSDPKVIDDVDNNLPATCTPPSGSSFAAGLTKVSCSVTNSFGNYGNCSFVVNMNSNLPQAFSQTNTGNDDTHGYLIAVIILGIMVVFLALTVVIVARYYKKNYQNNSNSLIMKMEE